MTEPPVVRTTACSGLDVPNAKDSMQDELRDTASGHTREGVRSFVRRVTTVPERWGTPQRPLTRGERGGTRLPGWQIDGDVANPGISGVWSGSQGDPVIESGGSMQVVVARCVRRQHGSRCLTHGFAFPAVAS